MKIGLSYSRCILDIINGAVNIEDVLVIITRTDFDPNNDEQWTSIWQGYGGGTVNAYTQGFFSQSNPEWAGYDDEANFREVTMNLYNSGRMHQPRQFGASPRRRPEIWLETVLPSSELEMNPAVKAAWNNFQIVAGLTNTTLDKEYK
jgi:hypothetical protein